MHSSFSPHTHIIPGNLKIWPLYTIFPSINNNAGRLNEYLKLHVAKIPQHPHMCCFETFHNQCEIFNQASPEIPATSARWSPLSVLNFYVVSCHKSTRTCTWKTTMKMPRHHLIFDTFLVSHKQHCLVCCQTCISLTKIYISPSCAQKAKIPRLIRARMQSSQWQ